MSITEKLELIDSLKSKIEELKPGKDWDDAFFKKVKLELTYTSNKLEGNTLTYGQTIKLLRDFVTPKDATKGEVLDMINHQKILDSIFINYRSQEISEENIKELHRELMKDRAQWADDGLYSPGQYKSFENMTVRSTGKIHKGNIFNCSKYANSIIKESLFVILIVGKATACFLKLHLCLL